MCVCVYVCVCVCACVCACVCMCVVLSMWNCEYVLMFLMVFTWCVVALKGVWNEWGVWKQCARRCTYCV